MESSEVLVRLGVALLAIATWYVTTWAFVIFNDTLTERYVRSKQRLRVHQELDRLADKLLAGSEAQYWQAIERLTWFDEED